MVFTAQHIAQEIAALEAQTATIAQELRYLYNEYLTELSQTASQQLMMVCYHLCTQRNPEEFLALSRGDRARLQSQVRNQSQQLQACLSLELLLQADPESTAGPDCPTAQATPEQEGEQSNEQNNEQNNESLDAGPAIAPDSKDLDNRPGQNDSVIMPGGPSSALSPPPAREMMLSWDDLMAQENRPDNSDDEGPFQSDDEGPFQLDFDPDFEPPPAEDRHLPLSLVSNGEMDISPGVLASALAAEGEDHEIGAMLLRPTPYSGSTELSPEAQTNPQALLRWMERMERGISQRLRQSSQRMTRTLEKFHILNNQLPDGLLEAASKQDSSDDAGQGLGQQPHILSLSLNAADPEHKPSREHQIQIVAIYLRLGEIEFATPSVMIWRNQLRGLSKRLKALEKAYQQKKHAKSIAEAQALWRSDWLNG